MKQEDELVARSALRMGGVHGDGQALHVSRGSRPSSIALHLNLTGCAFSSRLDFMYCSFLLVWPLPYRLGTKPLHHSVIML